MTIVRHEARFPVARAAALVIASITCLLLPSESSAQNASEPRKWTVELYGGGSMGLGTISGTSGTTFPAGTPFTLASGQPSRAVSSWFFGDGALLMNQVLAQFATATGTTFPRISSLDSALNSAGGKIGTGGLFGLRVGRALSEKLSVEFNAEKSLAKMELGDEMRDGLQAASDSFIEVFEAVLGAAPVTNLAVSSSVTTRKVSSSQARLAASLKWRLYRSGRLEGYVSGGAGMIRNGGVPPQAVLNGRYAFRYFGAFPMDETDRVVVTLNQQKTSAMGVIGGGVTFDFTSRSGLRADLRLLLNSSKDRTTMTAAPGVLAGNPPQVLTTGPGISPGLQFSTQSGVRSSLSGPNQNLTIFTGSGMSKQFAFSLGVFKRF